MKAITTDQRAIDALVRKMHDSSKLAASAPLPTLNSLGNEVWRQALAALFYNHSVETPNPEQIKHCAMAIAEIGRLLMTLILFLKRGEPLALAKERILCALSDKMPRELGDQILEIAARVR